MSNFIKLDDGSYAEIGSLGNISGLVVDESKDFDIPISIVIPPVTPTPTVKPSIEVPLIMLAFGIAVIVLGLALAFKRR